MKIDSKLGKLKVNNVRDYLENQFKDVMSKHEYMGREIAEGYLEKTEFKALVEAISRTIVATSSRYNSLTNGERVLESDNVKVK